VDDSYLCGRNIGSGFYQVNGKVMYGPMQPEFKDYLTMMAKWYGEGLIDKDFYTRNSAFGLGFDSSYISTGKVGVFNTAYSWIDFFGTFATDPNFKLVAIAPPTPNAADKRLITISQFVPATRDQTAVGTITPKCTAAATLAKWYDYFYTDEGALLANYGIEGTSYKMVDNAPVITEVIYANPDGLSINDALSKYACNQTQAMFYDWHREISPKMSENARAAGPKWDENWTDERTMPVVSVSTDDSAEFAGIMSDANTYENEIIVKFINGIEPLANYDKFISTLEGLGIKRAIEIQQKALERYNAR
jgi:putative aldouronate transport system substrate-binding protein